AGVEADRLEVARLQLRLDGRPAGRTIDRAQRLQPATAVTLREKGIERGRAGDERCEQAGADERHVPGDAQHRSRAGSDGGVDPAEAAVPGPEIGNSP